MYSEVVAMSAPVKSSSSTITSPTGSRVGGMNREMYNELIRGPSRSGATVFDSVAAKLTRKPSFNSQSYSTDDVPSTSAPVEIKPPAAAAAKLVVQPSHNMFTAPQPGSKPISMRAQSRLSSGYTRAATIDTPAPTRPTGTLAERLSAMQPAAQPAAQAQPAAAAAATPKLMRQPTITDIAPQPHSLCHEIQFYDGNRLISDDIVTLLGITKKRIPDVTVAQFDKLHAEAMEYMKSGNYVKK